MDPQRGPKMIADFIKEMAPLQIDVSLIFYKDGKPFLCAEKRKDRVILLDGKTMKEIDFDQLKNYDFTRAKFGLEYMVTECYSPSEFHSIKESIQYNKTRLRKDILNLESLKRWLVRWRLYQD